MPELAHRGDVAAVRDDKVSDDGETEAGAVGRGALVEALEDAREIGGRDARAGVG